MSAPEAQLYAWGAGFAGALGLAVGSFLNVVVHRIPLDQSVVRPRSACPACGAPIAARDNVPVLSWLLLRGRCRSCREPIPARYPAIELLTGLVAVAVWLRTVPRLDLVHDRPLAPGAAPAGGDAVVGALVMPAPGDLAAFLVYFGFFAALIAASAIDADHEFLPNEITLPGTAIGVLSAVLLGLLGSPEVSVGQSVAGALIGGGGLYALAWLGAAVFRKEAMGMGDVKLLAMIGAFLGAWPALLVTLLVSSVLGSIWGIGAGLLAGGVAGRRVRFGPFLAVGAAVHFFAGEELAAGWFRALGA